MAYYLLTVGGQISDNEFSAKTWESYTSYIFQGRRKAFGGKAMWDKFLGRWKTTALLNAFRAIQELATILLDLSNVICQSAAV